MIETKSAFAKRLGVDKSTITRAAQAGRLVLTSDGRVEVELSVERWYATKAGRIDVAARHAANRGGAGGMGAPADDRAASGLDSIPATAATGHGHGATGRGEGGVETRSEAQARKDSVAADLLELERAQKLGALIARDDAYAAMKFIGGALRAALDVMPDQTAPLVAPIMDLEEVRELLAEAGRSVLAAVGDAIERQRRELEAGRVGA